jgi:hypothetical protein
MRASEEQILAMVQKAVIVAEDAVMCTPMGCEIPIQNEELADRTERALLAAGLTVERRFLDSTPTIRGPGTGPGYHVLLVKRVLHG